MCIVVINGNEYDIFGENVNLNTMSKHRKQIEKDQYFFRPFCQPPLVIAVLSQLGPKERTEIIRIQRCPSLLEWPICKFFTALWRVLFTALRPPKKQSAVEVDNLIIQPLPRSQSDDILIFYCFSCKFSYLSPRFKKFLYSRFISGW